jgi:signal transduction histidine kinase
MDTSRARPFNLFRYFAGASLVVILVMTVAAGATSAWLVRDAFLHMERDEADSLAEYFATEFSQDGFPPAAWGTGAIPPETRARAMKDLANFGITELALLGPDGREKETFVPPGGAPNPPWTEGLAEASQGRVAIRWESAGGWLSLVLSRSFSGDIESYVPVREGGRVVAIARVRRNLNPDLVQAQRVLPGLVVVSCFAGLAIFGALALLVRRADRILTRQHEEIVAARKHLEEQNRILEEINRKKDEFYVACSHDLRSPLLAVQAGTKLVLTDKEEALTSWQREILEENTRVVSGVLDLVENILDLSRVGASEEVLRIQPVDLVGALRVVAVAYRSLASTRDVTIETVLPDDEVIVVADRLKLLRVFGNLVSNAIKHAPGKPVTVSLERRDRGARIVVRDEGPGIPPTMRDRVFERYEKGGDGGHGLGLAIAREFVHAHGGTISLASGEGRGTSFTVELPFEPPRPA